MWPKEHLVLRKNDEKCNKSGEEEGIYVLFE